MTETLQIDENSYYRLNEHGWILGMINEDTAWVAALLVPSEKRGKGHDSDFLSKFEDWSGSHSMKEVTIILKSNLLTDKATVEFFQKRGYAQDPDISA